MLAQPADCEKLLLFINLTKIPWKDIPKDSPNQKRRALPQPERLSPSSATTGPIVSVQQAIWGVFFLSTHRWHRRGQSPQQFAGRGPSQTRHFRVHVANHFCATIMSVNYDILRITAFVSSTAEGPLTLKPRARAGCRHVTDVFFLELSPTSHHSRSGVTGVSVFLTELTRRANLLLQVGPRGAASDKGGGCLRYGHHKRQHHALPVLEY